MNDHPDRPRVESVNISPGGKPKPPVPRGVLTPGGFEGDGRDHAKHYKPDRAVSLVDAEVFPLLSGAGGNVGPGDLGENLTVRGVAVRRLLPGTRLRFTGGVEIELTEPHKPCALPGGGEPIVIGSMARVLTPGVIEPGAEVFAGTDEAPE
jgi:MOSC domain-containing protein YiiM